MPILIKNSTIFNEKIQDAKLSVVHFSASWAEQCSQVNDLLDTLSKHEDFAGILFYTCEAENLSDVSLKYKIEAVPTVVLYRNSSVLDRINGADAVKITAKIKEYLKDSNTKKPSLEERLKSLINLGKVTLFMKGDKNVPRCGFSKQIIEILNNTGIKYETFDILSDEEVRQGLKKYSDWPTYPQLYVNGELIGGLDIVKELQSSGELVSSLNTQ